MIAKFQPILVPDDDPGYAEASKRWGVEGFPTIVFTGPDGVEFERSVGLVSAAEFRERAQQALDAMAE